MLDPMLEAVFDAFRHEDICWCLLYGQDNPAKGLELLVARADFGRARQLLERLEFAALPTLGRGSHTFFLGYHLPTDQWIKLDMVTDLSYGPYFGFETRAETECLTRRQRDGKMFMLAPDDAFWTLLLHCLLDEGAFPAQPVARLQQLAKVARTDSLLCQVIDSACPAGWSATRILHCARRDEWNTLTDFAPSLAAAWTRRYRVATWGRMFANRLSRLVEVPLMLMRRPGLSVALLGPDGAGKSTLAAGIQNSFYLPVRSVYMGLWQHRAAHSTWIRLPGLEQATRPLWIWQRYLMAQYHRALGRLVIFDRYTYDALLPPRPPLIWLKRLYFFVLAHACPAPDLVLVLDAPGQVMYERKGESTPASLEAERQHFLALRERIAQVQIVDATRTEAAVRVDVINRIWRQQRAHWRNSRQ